MAKAQTINYFDQAQLNWNFLSILLEISNGIINAKLSLPLNLDRMNPFV